MKPEALENIYHKPFFDLLREAREVHEANWPGREVQLCTLMSIKTGGCSEDCSYCSQSSRYKSDVGREALMSRESVLERATAAADANSTRFCMGAAWKGVRDGSEKFEQVLDIVRGVADLGLEVCVTLGEIGPVEAEKLREAGVTTYNHNIDTSPEHYPNIVTTHSFDDRLKTIRAVQEQGMSVCCGGILGMGESIRDRMRMLEVLTGFNPPPESVPINSLMPMPGTPLENADPVDTFDIIRMIATTRIALPKTKVRLSAGRSLMNREAQTLCFFAGANSIFYGDKLLTAPNPESNEDLELLRILDLQPQEPDRTLKPPTATAGRPLGPVAV